MKRKIWTVNLDINLFFFSFYFVPFPLKGVQKRSMCKDELKDHKVYFFNPGHNLIKLTPKKKMTYLN